MSAVALECDGSRVVVLRDLPALILTRPLRDTLASTWKPWASKPVESLAASGLCLPMRSIVDLCTRNSGLNRGSAPNFKTL